MSASEHLLEDLAKRHADGDPIRVAVVGGGVMGQHICSLLHRQKGLHPEFIITRHAATSAASNPWGTHKTLTKDLARLVDVVVDASGDVEVGALAAMTTLDAGRYFLSFSAETEALIGVAIGKRARAAGLVAGFADGDQPGVLVRLLNDCRLRGLDVRALVNCKGFLRHHAVPDEMTDWVKKSVGTSTRMITSFTDGTKLNQEMAVVANGTGFLPARRGMTGVKSTLATVAEDLAEHVPGVALGRERVDYTLGGDFGGGVLALVRDAEGPQGEVDGQILKHLKVGNGGPWRAIFRPYHLCSFEVPASIAETVVFHWPTVAALKREAEVVALAKRPLRPGEILDGIGGKDCYGQIDQAVMVRDYLPIGLAHGCKVVKPIWQDTPICWDDVEAPRSMARQLYEEQV